MYCMCGCGQITMQMKRTKGKYRQKHLHRVVAEQLLGRPLEKGEVVHHIDRNKKNCSPDNIEVCSSQSDHCKIHKFGKRGNLGGSNHG